MLSIVGTRLSALLDIKWFASVRQSKSRFVYKETDNRIIMTNEKGKTGHSDKKRTIQIENEMLSAAGVSFRAKY